MTKKWKAKLVRQLTEYANKRNLKIVPLRHK